MYVYVFVFLYIYSQYDFLSLNNVICIYVFMAEYLALENHWCTLP